MARRWQEFADITRGAPPRALLVDADGFVSERGTALDIGAGALNETRFLLQRGYSEVVALDLELLRSQDAAELRSPRFRYVRQSFADFVFPPDAFDLVNAQYALQFIRPLQFHRVFAAIRRSLRRKGVFAGQLLGPHDDWSGDPAMNFHTRQRARALFDGLELLRFDEEDVDDETADGAPKHWHVFHIIARRVA
ncbi:MAG: class I SAM-dependent methyltransferase [Bauldia sp.]